MIKWLTLAVFMVLAPGAVAVELVPLPPGKFFGTKHQIKLAAKTTVTQLAASYGVNPVRIERPHPNAGQDGLGQGETVVIDQRRIQPGFQPWVSGIVVNVPEAEVYLVNHGVLTKSYPAGVSQGGWQAPLGQTTVKSKQKNPVWHVPQSIQREMARKGEPVKKEVPSGPGNPLGNRWIGFANGYFGIHGTADPGSIKRYASHGCIRLTNRNVADLFERVQVGTPVRVYYQPVLIAVAGDQIWLAAHPDPYRLDPDAKAMVRELAQQAGVLDRLDWKAVMRVLSQRNGIPDDVARKPARPQGEASAKPTGAAATSAP